MIVVTSLTDGLGVALIAPIGMSEFATAATSLIIDTVVNFGINELFDAATGNLSWSNAWINLIFGVTDIGRLGRGLKYDKLIKISNESKLFEKLGIQKRVKSFYGLKQELEMKDIILKGGKKLTFGKTISDIDIVQAIAITATATTRKEIKKFTQEQLTSFLKIQKTIAKIHPGILGQVDKKMISKFDSFLKEATGSSWEKFIASTDENAIKDILKMSETRIGSSTISKMLEMRAQSQFQKQFTTTFKKNWKKIKERINSFNPITWADKLLEKMLKPIRNAFKRMEEKTLSFLKKGTRTEIKFLEKNNLIPCHPDSFLMGFKFEPINIGGEGFITIYKKEYISKKTGRISRYNNVRSFTNIRVVEMFATSIHQNSFYKKYFGLGYGYSQGELKFMKLVSPRLTKYVSIGRKFYNSIHTVKTILSIGIKLSVQNKIKKIVSSAKNRYTSKLTSLIPAGNFKSTVNNQIKGHGVLNSLSWDIGNTFAQFLFRR